MTDHGERENLKIRKHVPIRNLDNGRGMEAGSVIAPTGTRVRKPLSNVQVFIFLGRKLADLSSSVKGNEQIVQIVDKVILLAIIVLISLALLGGYQSFPGPPRICDLNRVHYEEGVPGGNAHSLCFYSLCSNTQQLSDQIFSVKEKEEKSPLLKVKRSNKCCS